MSSTLAPSPSAAAASSVALAVPPAPAASSDASPTASPWRTVRLFGLSVLWTWRVVTAPLRLAVWLAEAVVTLAMAAVILGVAAWAMGLIPDEMILHYGRPILERLGGFLVHVLEGRGVEGGG